LTILEFSQRLHGELLERARGSWIGLHVLGTCFEWLDLLAYLLATLTVLCVEPRIVGRARRAS
ncbi:MAG: DUF2809 domain-containing protein, partial [Byssovorax sp.]